MAVHNSSLLSPAHLAATCAAGALVAATALLLPAPAHACGGLFCSAVNLQPVEQNSERILFEILGNGEITTSVEIRYAGEPEDFSWVVPVPSTPELGILPVNTLLLLDDATAPSIVPPPTKCTGSSIGGGFGGIANDSSLRAIPESAPGGVVVEELERVGPFESVVVSSDDANELIVWLNDNDYLITREMEPFVADYVASGMKFLAMQLAADAAVSEIAPLRMTYEADEPMVPIVLTSVGAEPEMGVLAFIVAETRYESANFDNVVVDTNDVQADPVTRQTNYYPLLSWQIDQAGGRAMVTEYAGDLSTPVATATNNWGFTGQYDDELAFLDTLRQEFGQVSRLYTRLSGWEMELDPTFEPSDGASVSNVHDLSDREAIETCAPGNTSRDVRPCGDVYCGVDAMCASTDLGDACVCPDSTSARLISAPRAGVSFGFGSNPQANAPTVVCQRTDFDLMASLADMDDVGVGPDPCASDTCGGNGTCEAINGFATCACDDGYAAAQDGLGSLVCTPVQGTYGPDALLWGSVAGCDGCNAASDDDSSNPASGASLALLLGLAGLALRRRSSHRS